MKFYALAIFVLFVLSGCGGSSQTDTAMGATEEAKQEAAQAEMGAYDTDKKCTDSGADKSTCLEHGEGNRVDVEVK